MYICGSSILVTFNSYSSKIMALIIGVFKQKSFNNNNQTSKKKVKK